MTLVWLYWKSTCDKLAETRGNESFILCIYVQGLYTDFRSDCHIIGLDICIDADHRFGVWGLCSWNPKYVAYWMRFIWREKKVFYSKHLFMVQNTHSLNTPDWWERSKRTIPTSHDHFLRNCACVPFLVAVRCFADIMSIIDCRHIAKSCSAEVFVSSFHALVLVCFIWIDWALVC
jgi:hypothetical protein